MANAPSAGIIYLFRDRFPERDSKTTLSPGNEKTSAVWTRKGRSVKGVLSILGIRFIPRTATPPAQKRGNPLRLPLSLR